MQIFLKRGDKMAILCEKLTKYDRDIDQIIAALDTQFDPDNDDPDFWEFLADEIFKLSA